MKKISLLIVDDQSIIIDGLEAMLARESDLVVVGRAYNGSEAVAQARRLAPDVVLMDISMPGMDGIEATRALGKCCPKCRVLVLSMYNNRKFVDELLGVGAHGYLLKNTGRQELLEALRRVAAGGRYLGLDVQKMLANAGRTEGPHGTDGQQAITKREKEIIRLVCAGHSNPEIAERLHISPATVETHRKNIMHKLDIHHAAGLMKYAMERGWYG